MKLRAALVFLMLAAPSLQAQVPDPAKFEGSPSDAQLQSWLDSGSLRFAAWAGHDILVEERDGMVPALLPVLSRIHRTYARDPKAYTDEDRYAESVLLDTLVQRNSVVPVAMLDGWPIEFRVQQMILLMRLPIEQTAATWKKIYEPDSGSLGPTRVAAEMLAQRPYPGFAADLLGRTTLHAKITVWMQNQRGFLGYGEGSATSCCAGSGVQAKDWSQWPVRADDELQLKPQTQKQKALIEDTEPVYVHRTVGRFPASICGEGPFLTDAIRLRLLEVMAKGFAVPLVAKAEVRIEYRNDEDYGEQIRAFIDQERLAFHALTHRLNGLGLLNEEEYQAASFKIEVLLMNTIDPSEARVPDVGLVPGVTWLR